MSRPFMLTNADLKQMSEKEEPQGATALGLHEEFIQHVESAASKMRALSIITILVAFILVVLYALQLAFPSFSATPVVPVNLADPVLEALELLLLALTLVWLYVGVSDYRFTRRMTKLIKEARAAEREIEKRITG